MRESALEQTKTARLLYPRYGTNRSVYLVNPLLYCGHAAKRVRYQSEAN